MSKQKTLREFLNQASHSTLSEYADPQGAGHALEEEEAPLCEAIKNEDQFHTALAMGRIYAQVSRLLDGWTRGENWDMLGYMYTGPLRGLGRGPRPQDLTPAHKAELQKWATSFEKLADKLEAEMNRYKKG